MRGFIYAEILHLSETWKNWTIEGEKNKPKEKEDKYDDTLMKKSTSKQKKKKKEEVYDDKEFPKVNNRKSTTS